MVECCRSRSLPRSLGGLSPLCGGAGAFPLQRSNLGQTTPCRGSFDHGVPGQLRASTPRSTSETRLHQRLSRGHRPERRGRSRGLKRFPRNPPAVRSRLGLAWHCVRRGRAGVGAGQDCTELAAELFEPLVFFPHLQHPLLDCVLLHACIDRWMPIELLQEPSPRRQRCKEFLLAAVGRRKRLPGGRHGCNW